MTASPDPVLVIVVAEEWIKRPEIAALEAAGHRVYIYPGLDKFTGPVTEPDLILHPAAHSWKPTMWETPSTYLSALVDAARDRRRASQ